MSKSRTKQIDKYSQSSWYVVYLYVVRQSSVVDRLGDLLYCDAVMCSNFCIFYFLLGCSVLTHKSKQIYNEHDAVLCVCSRFWQFFRRRHRQTLRRFGRDGQEHVVQKILCEPWQNNVVWPGKHDSGQTDLESVYAARHHVYFTTINQIAF